MRRPTTKSRRLLLAIALALGGVGVTGCFGLFPLDGYGPGAGDAGEDALDAASPIDVADAGAVVDAKVRYEGGLVFVTRATFGGHDLGGLAGADAICAAIARDGGATGSFKAFLGDRGTDLPSRFRVDGGLFVTRNGDLVAGSMGELVTSGPRIALVEDERGVAVPLGGSCEDGGAAAWTGLVDAGEGVIDCGRWDLAPVPEGIASGLGGTQWPGACRRRCERPASLYCVQQ